MTLIAIHKYVQPHKKNLYEVSADFATLRRKALAGLKLKMGGAAIPKNYMERLEQELGVVAKMQLEKYFLVVSDILVDLRNMGILAGVWRGSSTGSFMCYCLGITQINPLNHESFFESFINPDNKFAPPICLDFSHIHHKEVFNYLRCRYENDSISSACSDLRNCQTSVSPATKKAHVGVYFIDMTGELFSSIRSEQCRPIHDDASVLGLGGYVGIGFNGLEILSVIEKIQVQIKHQDNLRDDVKACGALHAAGHRFQSLIRSLVLTDMRRPPQAEEAEKAILGLMLIDPEAIKDARAILDETQFYLQSNRVIFSSIGKLHDRQSAVNLRTLAELLKSSGRLFEIGGEGYLTELEKKASTPADLHQYVEMVRQKALLRGLISSAIAISEHRYNTEADLAKLMGQAEDKIFAMAHKRPLTGFVSADEAADDFTRTLEEKMKIRNALTGVPTGFHRFDEMTGGLQRADLIILAARPSQGKTAMALDIVHHAAVEKGIPTAVFSLELSRDSIFQRMMRSAAMFDLETARNGHPQRERWATVASKINCIRRAPLWIDDSSGLNVTEIRMRAERLSSELKQKNKELGLIVIDYLQLIQGDKKNENRAQEVSEISMRLKGLARMLNLPIMLLSQTKRDPVGNRPKLSDLRDFGSVEQAADVVAFIHREEYYRREDPAVKGLATLIIAKQRNGPTGDVDLNFLSQFTKFTNPVPRGIEEFPEDGIFPS